jgi:hypothetical protein
MSRGDYYYLCLCYCIRYLDSRLRDPAPALLRSANVAGRDLAARPTLAFSRAPDRPAAVGDHPLAYQNFKDEPDSKSHLPSPKSPLSRRRACTPQVREDSEPAGRTAPLPCPENEGNSLPVVVPLDPCLIAK